MHLQRIDGGVTGVSGDASILIVLLQQSDMAILLPLLDYFHCIRDKHNNITTLIIVPNLNNKYCCG